MHPSSYTHTKPAALVMEYVIHCSIATPNKIAIEFFPNLRVLDLESVQLEEFITYTELYRCLNQFACYLVEKGIKQEDCIMVCSQCGANFHIVMFRVLKTEGYYVLVYICLIKCSQCTNALPTDKP